MTGLYMAEGKGIEPLSVRIARGSSPLCHLDATFYILAESSVIETHTKRYSLFSKQAYHLDSLLSFMFCIIHNYLKKKTTRRWSSNVVAYVVIHWSVKPQGLARGYKRLILMLSYF